MSSALGIRAQLSPSTLPPAWTLRGFLARKASLLRDAHKGALPPSTPPAGSLSQLPAGVQSAVASLERGLQVSLEAPLASCDCPQWVTVCSNPTSHFTPNLAGLVQALVSPPGTLSVETHPSRPSTRLSNVSFGFFCVFIINIMIYKYWEWP